MYRIIPCRTRQGIILFYIVLRFAAMPVPGLAVKARPGSGRGCTNGGLASSAPGGARPPFLSDATEPSLFLYCFPVCRDARPGARRKDSPRQRARLHKRRLCFLRPRRRKAAVPLGRDRGLFFFYNVFRFAARRLRRTLQITKSIGRLYKDLTSVLSIATNTHSEEAARFDIYATKK